jgi:Tol biopolymer transport system component
MGVQRRRWSTMLVAGLAGAVPLLVAAESSASVADVTQVDVSSSEVPASGFSSDPAMSGNGRFVVFTSDASNLVSGDSNGETDVFLRNHTAGTTRIVSRAGAPANGASYDASVSNDGRFVVFTSEATNLDGGGAGPDVFLRDMTTGTVTRIGNGVARARLSANGRYVTYWSDGSSRRYDRTTGESVTVNSGGSPEISGSGRYVVTSDIDEDDQPVYLFTDLRSGTTRDLLAAAKSSRHWDWDDYPGSAVISTNGRYVAFHSDAAGIVPSDRGESEEFYVVDTRTGAYHQVAAELSDEIFFVTPWDDGFDLAISGNGRILAFGIFDATVAEFGQLVTVDRVSGLVSRVTASYGAVGAALDATGSRIAYQDEDAGGVFVGSVPRCTINGTAGNDTLVGTTGPDVICGRGGNDVIEGRDGADILAGGPGTDTVSFSRSNSDVVVRLYAWFARGAGRDEVYGFENVDGSAYDDRIFANHRDNRLRGFAGNDVLVGHAGDDAMIGGRGSDSCDGEDGTNTATGCEAVDDAQ